MVLRAEREQSESETDEISETASEQNSNLSDELTKLNGLKEKGIISQEEFEKAKNKLLNN
jgi:multidrug resistance efflux pump